MQITLTPQRSDATLTLARSGTTLIINGTAYDFGPVGDGAVLPRDAVDCAALASDVTRIGGVLHLTLILPVGANPPMEARFPEPVIVVGDGPIALPEPNLPDEVL
jgi:hypothetical protein